MSRNEVRLCGVPRCTRCHYRKDSTVAPFSRKPQHVDSGLGHPAGQALFEQRLRQLDLGVEQLEDQSLDELTESLERINGVIANPESLGIFELKRRRRRGGVTNPAQPAVEAQLPVGLRPLLSERRRLVLERIHERGAQSARQVLAGLADGGSGEDGEEGSAAEALKALTVTDSVIDRENRRETERARNEQLVSDIHREKAQIWQRFFDRNSVASIVGGLLAMFLGITVIVAMFTAVAPTDVVSNAFLLILGYFFGQTVLIERSPQDAALEVPPATTTPLLQGNSQAESGALVTPLGTAPNVSSTGIPA
jgi:hypothetical protein